MTNDGRPATGGWRDDSTDPDRIRPDYPAGGRLSGGGQPAAHPRAHRATTGRFHRGRADQDVDPQKLLGAAFQPLVSLAVAIILYDEGLGLDLRKLRGHTRKVVIALSRMRPASPVPGDPVIH